MNKILDSITSTLDFYNPYFKQFKKHLTGNKIAIIESTPSKAYEFFSKEDYDTICIEEIDNIKLYNCLDGIIINNYKYENINELLDKIHENLKDDGILLFIYNNQNYDKDTINFMIKEKFTLIEELLGDDKWNFILYLKKTTK